MMGRAWLTHLAYLFPHTHNHQVRKTLRPTSSALMNSEMKLHPHGFGSGCGVDIDVVVCML